MTEPEKKPEAGKTIEEKLEEVSKKNVELTVKAAELTKENLQLQRDIKETVNQHNKIMAHLMGIGVDITTICRNNNFQTAEQRAQTMQQNPERTN